MFRHADRFPTSPAAARAAEVARPWGLSRMEPFGQVSQVDAVLAGIDPLTQTGRYVGPGGMPLEAGKHGSNTGTENKTQTHNVGDGGQQQTDQDHTQDNDRD